MFLIRKSILEIFAHRESISREAAENGPEPRASLLACPLGVIFDTSITGTSAAGKVFGRGRLEPGRGRPRGGVRLQVYRAEAEPAPLAPVDEPVGRDLGATHGIHLRRVELAVGSSDLKSIE